LNNCGGVATSPAAVSTFPPAPTLGHPTPSATTNYTATPTATSTPSICIYTVVRGDTLYDIAGRYDVSLQEIIRLNSIGDADTLGIGQQLIIPLPSGPGCSPGVAITPPTPKPTQWQTAEEGFIATESDGFDAENLESMKQAGDNIAAAFADVLGPDYSSEEAWNTVFGNTTVTFVDIGYDCHDIGVNIFDESDFGNCWAVAGPDGQVYVSTEFTDKTHNAGAVVEWASHETGHQVDRLMTDLYDDQDGQFYGAFQMTQFPGGIDTVNAAIPDDYRQSSPDERGYPVEVFADAFLCWSHPDCEFADPKFAEYFDDLMTDFALARANQ